MHIPSPVLHYTTMLDCVDTTVSRITLWTKLISLNKILQMKKKSLRQDFLICDLEIDPSPWDISMFFRTGSWFNPSPYYGEEVVFLKCKQQQR